MGNVPDLYTSGDNDPEIEPVRYYRHYLYCDACGSFELDAWMMPEDHERIERTRRRLAQAALLALPLVLVSAWLALGLLPSPTFLVGLVAAVALALLAWPIVWRAAWGWPAKTAVLAASWRAAQPISARWRFFKWALLWWLVVATAELSADAFFSTSLLLVTGLAVVVGSLLVRAVLGSKIECVGMRCRRCAATYAYGTPLFTNLDANPRNLTPADVPRPLGSSPFLRGRSVDYAAPEDSRALPP